MTVAAEIRRTYPKDPGGIDQDRVTACADVCAATAQILSRHNGYDVNATRALLEACVRICASCAGECERYASMHEHCRVCAEQRRLCEQACRDLLAHL
ncbi:four-helix bundle copper-binding protein [Actinokineospora xionganensis]|uniref:Four-helix bundle copper-binding protein n=1 Tax=Actinokineospora xionganensis TaxID=2684470 RepID=A0ABR7L004_9PSEU|nr:four-helix bundle copper-binding protein [Actinokineospora xionganensis]MBC6445932.1 four-helix bundle copper-binding protein [Actinokineospora xionganensis]